FLDAAPARVAPDIDDGSEHELHAASANLAPRDCEYALEQGRIPTARQRDGMRKVRGAAGRVAMQSFLVKQHWDAETRAARVALHGVDELDGLAHVPIRSLQRIAGPLQVGRPGEVADAVRIQAARRCRIELPVAIEQLVFLRP